MNAFVPVVLLAIIAVGITIMGNILLMSAATMGKFGPVWVGLGIGAAFTLAAYFGSKGGTPQLVPVRHDDDHSGHH